MLKVPEDLQKKYSSLLINSEICPAQYVNFRKWMRYYLYFCKKNGHAYAEADSLDLLPIFSVVMLL